jgi:cytochrome oxidase Cu insertion factor (SCO1/SenC/PrrC family)
MNNAAAPSSKQKQGRRTLLLILALFILPILIVLFMYYFSLRPSGASHGDLLNPPRILHFPPMATWQKKTFSEAQLHEKWSLLYIAPANCAAPCAAQIHMLRQIHASLGKEMGRAQRVALFAEPVDTAQIDAIQRDYPDMIILANPETVAKLVSQLKLPAQTGGRIVLVDPLANAMMHYAPAADPNGIRKDLSHLLRYSWAG